MGQILPGFRPLFAVSWALPRNDPGAPSAAESTLLLEESRRRDFVPAVLSPSPSSVSLFAASPFEGPSHGRLPALPSHSRPHAASFTLASTTEEVLGRCVAAFLEKSGRQKNLRHAEIADRLNVPRTTFYGWVNGRRTISAKAFVDLLNLLEVEDPSWLCFVFFRSELERYFDPSVVDGKIRLITKMGTDQRGHPIDLEKLKRFGFAGVFYEARVTQGLSLDQVADRINELPEKKATGRQARGDILSQYERQIMIPNEGPNRAFLDYLIQALNLDPSEAYLSVGRSWLPGLIPVFDRSNPMGLELASVQRGPTYPPWEEDALEPPVTSRRTHKLEAKGLGALIRKGRLLSGLSLDEAAERCGLSRGCLKDFELHEAEPPYETLRTFAREFGEGIRRLAPKFSDPLAALVSVHNAQFYPEVGNSDLLWEGRPLYLACATDARAARRLSSLPKWNFRRKFFVYRLSRQWSREAASRELNVYMKATNVIEDPRRGYFPSWKLVSQLAAGDPHPEGALQEWRESVQKTFYPDLPWELLEEYGIYIASPTDLAQLKYYLAQGTARETHLGWRLFRLRVGLAVNETRQEAADRAGISKSALSDAEYSRRPTSRKVLAAVAGAHGLDLEWLASLEQPAAAGEGELSGEPWPHLKAAHRRLVASRRYGRLLAPKDDYVVCEADCAYTTPTAEAFARVGRLLVHALKRENRIILHRLPFLPEKMSLLQARVWDLLTSVGRKDFQVLLVGNECLLRVVRSQGRTEISQITAETSSDASLYLYEEVQKFLQDGSLPRSKIP